MWCTVHCFAHVQIYKHLDEMYFSGLSGQVRVQVVDGRVRRDAHRVRVKRDNRVVWEGRLIQVKQVKQEVDQVGKGSECGLMFDGFEEFEVGDSLEVVEMQKRRPKVDATATGATRLAE